MNSPWLIMNNTSYSLSDIRLGNFDENSSISENAPLSFCKHWLNGNIDFILRTSGSTGTPKKISVTREQLKASAQVTASYLNLKKEFTALVCLDTRYVAGIMMLVRSLEVGMNMYVVEPTANPFEKIPNDVPIDFVALVPYQLESILKSNQSGRLNSLKIALIGGASLSEKIKNSLFEFNCSFYSTYGMTETLSHIALQKLNGAHVQNFFQILPGIAASTDERGCLVIQAPYINPAPIITNDLVEMIGTDQFKWLGRVDNVINSGGIKVIPEKIESVIEPIMSTLSLSNRFFITGLSDSTFGELVTLIIEGETLLPNQEQDLQKQLAESLNRYEIPKSIRYVSKFIQTDTGKINKPKTLEILK
ncbi:MAG TPA: AMP-binding protein [Cyclobacteriaceae bacterium]|nr:AMP-binding protein [Cyclobacteriaceae bacterium]